MQRRFNTTGPCTPDRHYMLSSVARLPDVEEMFDADAYFVVHAPRQTGKTTAMKALAESLRQGGRKVHTSPVASAVGALARCRHGRL